MSGHGHSSGSSSSKSSGVTAGGMLAILAGLFILLCIIFGAFRVFADDPKVIPPSPPTPPSAPGAPSMPRASSTSSVAAPLPVYYGEVDGAYGENRRGVKLKGASSKIYASGTESVRNAQTIHHKALKLADAQQERINGAIERTAEPEVVTQTIVLEAPAPRWYYTVVGAYQVRDRYGDLYFYNGGQWFYKY